MAGPSEAEADRKRLSRAIGSLIWKDPERILEAVSRLKGSDAAIECRLRGGSMEPAIPRGSLLRIGAGESAPCRIGDVVAFIRGSEVCVHRVAYIGRGARSANYLVTQGDACFYPDAPVASRQVVGRVTAFRSDQRWIPVAGLASAGRARSILGRTLRTLMAALMEIDARLARGAAKLLRIRPEGGIVVEDGAGASPGPAGQTRPDAGDRPA